ncbi:hypothetical protein CSB37_03710 [bacterium DOLZORAL124_38_8]|nr:MAG: hypothetical protein CSB37_03710 [bacterium DOLZORAL124_38_8]
MTTLQENIQLIQGKTIPELFSNIDESNRLLTYRELIKKRIESVGILLTEMPHLENIINQEKSQEYFQVMAAMKHFMHANREKFLVWYDRYVTSTNVVMGEDEVYFVDKQLEANEVAKAIKKGLKDGGFDYSQYMPEIIDNAYSTIDKETYLDAKGGAFSVEDFCNHDVFRAAINNDEMNAKYRQALKIMSADSFSPHPVSGWVQAGFPTGFGRPVAGGLGEATFYPPNNSTLNHVGIIVPKI